MQCWRRRLLTLVILSFCPLWTAMSLLFVWSSEVAATSSTSWQFVPKTDHLPWWLVMCSEVALHASILTKLPIVGVLDCCHGIVISLNPHSHAYILHFKQLPKNIYFSHLQFWLMWQLGKGRGGQQKINYR